MIYHTDGHEPQTFNPMKHEGKCSWYLDEEGTKEATIYFDYFRQYGTLYVTEIDYRSDVALSDETLKEAVINELGPCQFEDTEIYRSND